MYAKQFEEFVAKQSKSLFNNVFGLYHWDLNTKMVLCMLAFFCPICFGMIGGIALGLIACYNLICEFIYDRKLAILEE